MEINLSQPSGRYGLCASLLSLTLVGSKHREGAEQPRFGVHCLGVNLLLVLLKCIMTMTLMMMMDGSPVTCPQMLMVAA